MTTPLVEIAFEGEVIEWRGPAPLFFVAVPEEHVASVRDTARTASYGWGCVPVAAEMNGVPLTTSLFPRDGSYLVPLKTAVRERAGMTLGDRVGVLSIGIRRSEPRSPVVTRSARS